MIDQPKMMALKSIAIRQENSSSNSSMCSDENNDAVTPMHGDHADWFSFRQVDYLWLFDPEMKFSIRQGFKLEETSVNTEDYKQMRKINRRKLANFLKKLGQSISDFD
jgi:hypothetical protein